MQIPYIFLNVHSFVITYVPGTWLCRAVSENQINEGLSNLLDALRRVTANGTSINWQVIANDSRNAPIQAMYLCDVDSLSKSTDWAAEQENTFPTPLHVS